MTTVARSRHRRLRLSMIPVALLPLGLAACSGGTAKVAVDSTPTGLAAYAVPNNKWVGKDGDTLAASDVDSAFSKYKYTNTTPTSHRDLSTDTRYVFVVLNNGRIYKDERTIRLGDTVETQRVSIDASR